MKKTNNKTQNAKTQKTENAQSGNTKNAKNSRSCGRGSKDCS